jgi:protoporphyrinogen oxidase
MMELSEGIVHIIGAGPSGMACAHTLAKGGHSAIVITEEKGVGGLCQTLEFSDYLFDIGGHRFLSKSGLINSIWKEVMGDDLLQVRRLSRIFYRKRFFNYPLSFFNTFRNLGPFESFRCVASYGFCRLTKPGDDQTFEGWIINRFGKRLYKIFFDTYTRKVWAVPCKDISADWAVQRIRGLSLRVAIKKALLGARSRGPKTLAEEFLYPKKGPGQFYAKMERSLKDLGTRFLFEKRVVAVNHRDGRVVSIGVKDGSDPVAQEMPVDYLFSSMPLTDLIQSLNPQPPGSIRLAASKLRFRSFLVVNVILDCKTLFPDQWIYVHSPDVQLGRIQNYKNWSPFMTANPERTSLGLEYFCSEGDELWEMNDVDLIDFAVEELEEIGIVSRKHLINGFVVRRKNVYPVYSLEYQRALDVIRKYLSRFDNLQTMGRAGLFRYDNSDHAMLSGIGAAKNYMDKSVYNLWSQGPQQEYLEM